MYVMCQVIKHLWNEYWSQERSQKNSVVLHGYNGLVTEKEVLDFQDLCF
jgi:hypothetical protein